MAATEDFDEQMHQARAVLDSEVGVPALVDRLMLSIKAAKDFARFLKMRSELEDAYAQGLLELSRREKPPHPPGDSYGIAHVEMLAIHVRIGEAGYDFARNMRAMHNQLAQAAMIAERSLKDCEANGMVAETRVAGLEEAMCRAKDWYDWSCGEYDRGRNGDAQGNAEDDLLKRARDAERVYSDCVLKHQTEHAQLVSGIRPLVVETLQEAIQEMDAILGANYAKFTVCAERHFLVSGLAIHPDAPAGRPLPQIFGLRGVASIVQDHMDLIGFLAEKLDLVTRRGEARFDENPAMAGAPSAPPHAYEPQGQGQAEAQTAVASPDPSPPRSAPAQPTEGDPSNTRPRHHLQAEARRTDSMIAWAGTRGQLRSAMPSQGAGAPPPQADVEIPSVPQAYSNGSAPPAATGQAAFLQPEEWGPLLLPGLARIAAGFPDSGRPGPWPRRRTDGTAEPPHGKMFHWDLVDLYDRDNNPVPLVVHQCVQAVELFGLGVEGVYRQSGSLSHIQSMKAMFDRDPYSPALDFRNPANFNHDINSVAGLLKQFFRDLPDTLLTSARYGDLIRASDLSDEVESRDVIHAVVNGLEDAHYATLRVVALHLHRVAENESATRMGCSNLAVVFGPTLMGNDDNIADSGKQIRVVELILKNTLAIFNEDE